MQWKNNNKINISFRERARLQYVWFHFRETRESGRQFFFILAKDKSFHFTKVSRILLQLFLLHFDEFRKIKSNPKGPLK